MKKLVIGLVGTSQLSFPGDKESAFLCSVRQMEENAAEMGFSLVVFPKTVIDETDAREAVAFFEEQKIDFLLMQHTSYSAGNLSLIFTKIRGAYLGLWAIPEGAQSGAVPFNSLCSVNMHQAIIYHYLKDSKIKVKWFYGDASDEAFKKRLGVSVRALSALKALKNSRVALIGGIAPGFNDLYNDERQFLRMFYGMTYNRLHEYDEIKSLALAIPDTLAEKTAEKILACSCGADAYAKKSLLLSAKFYHAYKQFVEKNKYDAIAVSCWPKFQDDFKYSVCSVVAQLNDEGIPTGCEGDILSTICMLALKYITDDVTGLMDLIAFDEQDDSVLIWHCGPAGSRFGKTYNLGANYSGIKHIPGQPPIGCGVVRDMEFDEIPVTFFRLTGECDKYMLLQGDFIGPGKKSFIGSRGWMNNLRLDGAPITAKNLVNTILVNGFQHHYPMVPGDVMNEIKELAAWLGIAHIPRVAYADHLQVIG